MITRIEFQEEEGGISFILNEGKDLCGAVIISLNDIVGNRGFGMKYQNLCFRLAENTKKTTGKCCSLVKWY